MIDEAALEAYETQCTRVFNCLFKSAKTTDEFEYVCALLRVRGDESSSCDPLHETNQLISDLLRLISESSEQRLQQIRLELLLYAHITEVNSVYFMIENLLRISAGERYNHDPFQALYLPKKKPRISQRPPSAYGIVKHLLAHARRAAQGELVEIIDGMFNSGIRNAFAHADYDLVDHEFRTREGWLEVDNVKTRSIALNLLEMQIRQGFLFYEAFFVEYKKSKHEYTENIITTGRLIPGKRIPVEILADNENGVYGFVAKNPTDS